MDFLQKAREIEEQIIAWRREIHQHPELGFEETRTANLVAENLRQFGLEVQTGVAETGVVARLGEGRPAIGIRADMDALPIQEAVESPFKSQVDGKMHACGHDAHTAILLGVAKMLTEMPERPAGEIRFIFQPSEERWRDSDGHSGGSLMVEQQALADLDAVLALHVSSLNDSGTVSIADGHILAAVDTFEATIYGEGTHGAAPHNGLDPIWMQAQIVNAIQAIRSRRLNPTAPSVITIGAIHAGLAPNVIPAEVQMRGTIRSYSEEIRNALHEELEKAFALARAFGGDYKLSISRGYPALYNDPAVADKIADVGRGTIGEEQVMTMDPIMGAEDFAYMAQQAPGAMFMLGARKDEVNRPHHSPIFDLDEGSFKAGAAVLAATTVRLLEENGG